MTAHRPLAYTLNASEPEPWSVAAPDTEPDRPGRYSWIAPARLDAGHAHPSAAPQRAAMGRTCRATDPCIVPPPGSDRRGAAVVVMVVAAPGAAPMRAKGSK